MKHIFDANNDDTHLLNNIITRLLTEGTVINGE
jgi:hypothetical protein